MGKAQARMDGILSADGNSTSKQNEMLKAAAKQVCLSVCVSAYFLSACLSVHWSVFTYSLNPALCFDCGW